MGIAETAPGDFSRSASWGSRGAVPLQSGRKLGTIFESSDSGGGEIRKFGFGGRGAVPDPRRGLNLLQFRDLPQEERQSCGGEANGGFRRPGEK